MTKEELAIKLNGLIYTESIPDYLLNAAKENNLVIVTGYSDDLIELDGAVSDEADKYKGGKVHFNLSGFCGKKKAKVSLDALFCKKQPYTWAFETKSPHATFEVIDIRESEIEDRKQCLGIVISLDEV